MNKKIHHKIAYSIVAIMALAAAAALIIWYYPAAIVGGQTVTLTQYHRAVAVAQKLDPSANPQAVLNQLIKTSEEQQLVRILGVSFGAAQVKAEAEYLESADNGQYQDLSSKYFANNEQDFEDLVIRPRALDAALRVKYNSDSSNNITDYKRAQDLLSQINAGQKFEDVAVASSDDKVTGQLGGDLGFVSPTQLLPELAAVLPTLKVGSVAPQVYPSRLGYHLLYVPETSMQNGQKLYHTKQILVQTSGYDAWLASQTKRFWVFKLK